MHTSTVLIKVSKFGVAGCCWFLSLSLSVSVFLSVCLSLSVCLCLSDLILFINTRTILLTCVFVVTRVGTVG